MCACCDSYTTAVALRPQNISLRRRILFQLLRTLVSSVCRYSLRSFELTLHVSNSYVKNWDCSHSAGWRGPHCAHDQLWKVNLLKLILFLLTWPAQKIVSQVHTLFQGDATFSSQHESPYILMNSDHFSTQPSPFFLLQVNTIVSRKKRYICTRRAETRFEGVFRKHRRRLHEGP